MSVKGHTYKEISGFLKQEVEGLQFVDKYRGQLDDINNFVMPRPAVLISFGRFEWKTLNGNIKEGTGVIRFRTIVENYADSFTGSTNQDAALAFFQFNEDVHKALEGLSGSYFSQLSLLTDEDDEDHGNLIVTVMEYQTTLINNSANKTKEYILTDPDLKVEHKKNLPGKEVSDSFIVRL